MKRFVAMLCLCMLLCGCGSHQESLDRAMALRAKLLTQGVSFRGEITADYGDRVYTFTMDCVTDAKGDLKFTVASPESIAGITGNVSDASGKLTFDDTALSFELMADGLLAPVSGPWILMHTLRSGYLTSCTSEGELLRVSIDDSYREDALHLDIWLDGADAPVRAEIIWEGRRLLSMDISNFQFV